MIHFPMFTDSCGRVLTKNENYWFSSDYTQ